SYLVYLEDNLTSPIASTKETSIVIDGLSAGTEYAFVVRAKDVTGNIDLNQVSKSGRTLSYPVPEFDGLASATVRAGILGLNRVTLKWLSAFFDATRDAATEG